MGHSALKVLTERSNMSVFAKFTEYNLYEKGLAQSTVDPYVSDISQFFRFLKEANRLFSQQAIDDYFKFLKTTELSSSSRRRKQMSLRCLIEFLNQSNFFQNRREYFFDPIKKEKPNIRIVSDLQAQMLFKHCDNNLLDQCILSLLYCSGLRVSELINLNIEDINLETRDIKVKGKGCKERIVPMSKPSRDILTKYLQKKLQIKLDFQPLLVNNQQNRINRFYVRDRVLKMCRECRIGHFSPHDFRHSCATNLLNNGMELDLIKILLGHNNIAETQVYLTINQKELKKTHDKFHPRR